VKLEKPWGEVRVYTMNQTSTVKLITLEPNQETSIHYHQLRDDMWVILDDGLEVRIGERVYRPRAGDEFVIPAEQSHQIRSLGGRGKVLEIDFGFTSEDDTHRLADRYGRELQDDLDF
jgi:mannose-6-phosphate isomerase-like protein (cupin superfamily)